MRRHLVLRVSQGMAWCVVWLSQGMDLEVSHIRVVDLVGKGRHLVALRLSQGLGLESSHHLIALMVLMST